MAKGSQVSFWHPWRAARDLNWFAMTTIVLTVLALGLYVLAVRPLASQAHSLRGRVAELESHIGNRRHDAEPAQPASQLSVFYEQLPSVAQAPDVVHQLHLHAQRAGLTLERGDYRPLPDASARLVRYQIVLPVMGGYLQVRHFLADTMRDMPELSLDGISFQRDKGASGQLEVQLRFTAFLRTTG